MGIQFNNYHQHISYLMTACSRQETETATLLLLLLLMLAIMLSLMHGVGDASSCSSRPDTACH